MLIWILQQIIISLVVIALIHSIYNFLQSNLTTPKVRDLVNKPTKQYEEIYKSFKDKSNESNETNSSSMKNELQNYLKELSNKKEPPKNIENSRITGKIDSGMRNIEAGDFSDNFSAAYESF
jgi:cell shape-determining protein MreC